MSIRVLIVDDETPARDRLATLLAESPGFEVVGQCDSGPAAVDAIAELGPDLVFLDVQMPEMSGFEVIDAVGVDAFRALVFVTAYDEFALRAFDARALDYLLKPFTTARFEETLSRTRRVLAGEIVRDLRERVDDAVRHLLPPLRDRRIAARDGNKVVFVRIQEIEWIEGDGNYVRIHAAGRALSLRTTLKATTQRLAEAGFRRIAHSIVVNVERISMIERIAGSGYRVTLESGTVLTTSRTYEDQVRALR